jgi:tetratricopeptide (TPR) repeat protein
MRADEHPEELIDRARRGGLAPEEQATLERHLAGCAVCAGQLSLAQQFEQELAPQARDELLYQRAVDGALRRVQRSPAAGRRRALPRWSRWAAAAALLAFGVTGAAAVIKRRMAARPPVQPPVPAVEPPAAHPPAEAPVAPEPAPAKAAPPAHAAPHPVVTAGALFEQAEKLRREGHADAAIATYRRLQARFPATSEGRLSFALAGQLLLARGRPGDALAQFDRHLSVDGQGEEGEGVREEALAGKATALEQLHRTPQAIAAWKSLLARYPRSVYAGRARERLEQLTKQQ